MLNTTQQKIEIEQLVHAAQVVPSTKLAPEFGAKLREEILASCAKFQSSIEANDKNYLRTLHLIAKKQAPGFDSKLMLKLFEKHKKKFRTGSEIDPTKISPSLRFIEENTSSDSEIFRLVRGMWSMPHNKGYGRRLRFVVYDDYHEAVIGIIGLQSPPADLGSRDALFNYPKGRKLDLVNSTMDAFAVGAIPPYSYLLGGKLCAGLISSDAVRQAYWRRYAGKKTWMNDQSIGQPLVAVTTTSAFGRSSIYNRLSFNGRLLAKPIGYTLGYGTLHLEHLYESITEFLRDKSTYKVGGFGNGPKIRWQNITNVLAELKLPGSLLRHGVRREVFMFSLVDDLEGGMAGSSFGNPLALSVEQFSQYWKERWAMPRAARYPLWNTGSDLDTLRNALTVNVI